MVLLDHIDSLTLQVAALSGAPTGDQGVSAEAEDKKIEDEDKSDVEDADKKSSEDDDGDMVVVSSHQGCQASDMYAVAIAGSSSSQAPENPHFLTCPQCQHRFPPPPPCENWYAVTHGTQVGIFNDWNDAVRHVVRVKGAVFKRYVTRTEAEAAFNTALTKGNIQVIA
ncbi:hypothetical protein C8J56DRAFT_880828 [Mycena floridula]|nr:hypothetical protein C8J56DRAFT_880828 [Mycena floridula]